MIESIRSLEDTRSSAAATIGTVKSDEAANTLKNLLSNAESPGFASAFAICARSTVRLAGLCRVDQSIMQAAAINGSGR